MAASINQAVHFEHECPEAMQMRLDSPWRLPVGVPTMENMEEFVAAVAAHVPVEIERRRTPLPIWTRETIACITICSALLSVLFTGLGYALVQFP